jgi:antitoxin MazE
MRARIQMWGNSLALRIPKAFANEAHLRQDELVEVLLVDGKLVVEPIVKPKPTLDALLAGVTEENLHAEVDFGPPVGREEW